MTSIEETLLSSYGPLLNIEQLAEVLKKSPESLRISLRSTSNEWSTEINSARKKIGRRLYFRTSEIAQFLES